MFGAPPSSPSAVSALRSPYRDRYQSKMRRLVSDCSPVAYFELRDRGRFCESVSHVFSSAEVRDDTRSGRVSLYATEFRPTTHTKNVRRPVVYHEVPSFSQMICARDRLRREGDHKAAAARTPGTSRADDYPWGFHRRTFTSAAEQWDGEPSHSLTAYMDSKPITGVSPQRILPIHRDLRYIKARAHYYLPAAEAMYAVIPNACDTVRTTRSQSKPNDVSLPSAAIVASAPSRMVRHGQMQNPRSAEQREK